MLRKARQVVAASTPIRPPSAPDTVEDAIVARVAQRSRRPPGSPRPGRSSGARSTSTCSRRSSTTTPTGSAPLAELADHHILLPAQDAGPARVPARPDLRRHLRRIPSRPGVVCTCEPRKPPRAADLGTDAFLSLHFERAADAPRRSRRPWPARRAATAMSSHREARDLYERALRTPPNSTPRRAGHLLEAYAERGGDRPERRAPRHSRPPGRRTSRRAPAGRGGRRRPAGRGPATCSATASRPVGACCAAASRARRITRPAQDNDDPATDCVAGPAPRRAGGRLHAGPPAGGGDAYAMEARRSARATGDVRPSATPPRPSGPASCSPAGWRRVGAPRGYASPGALTAGGRGGARYRMLGSCASVLVEYERARRGCVRGSSTPSVSSYGTTATTWPRTSAHVAVGDGRAGTRPSGSRPVPLSDGRGGVTTRITALHVLGYVALGRGDLGRAADALAEARDLGERMGELQRLSPALWGWRRPRCAAGERAGAIAWCERRARRASATVEDAAYLFPFVVTGTRAYLAAGDPARRPAVGRRGPARRRAAGDPRHAARDRARRGLVAMAHGRAVRRGGTSSRPSHGWTERQCIWEAAWAGLDLAGPSTRANQRAEAATARAEEVARWAAATGAGASRGSRARACSGRSRARRRPRRLGATHRPRAPGRAARGAGADERGDRSTSSA